MGKLRPRACQECGSSFDPGRKSRQRFCSVECRAKARRRKLSGGELLRIQALAATGARDEDVRLALGMSLDAWRRLRKEPAVGPLIEEALATGRSLLHDRLVGKLLELADKGNIAALIYACKALLGYSDRPDLQAPRTPNVQVAVVLPKSLPAEEWRQLVAGEPLALEGEVVDA